MYTAKDLLNLRGTLKNITELFSVNNFVVGNKQKLVNILRILRLKYKYEIKNKTYN